MAKCKQCGITILDDAALFALSAAAWWNLMHRVKTLTRMCEWPKGG